MDFTLKTVCFRTLIHISFLLCALSLIKTNAMTIPCNGIQNCDSSGTNLDNISPLDQSAMNGSPAGELQSKSNLNDAVKDNSKDNCRELYCLNSQQSQSSYDPSADTDKIDLWTPDSNVSRHEWMRCHGMPCDKWDRTRNKLKYMEYLESMMQNRTDTNTQNSKDPVSHNHETDGCLLFTESQTDAIISNLEIMVGINQNSRVRRASSNSNELKFKKWPKRKAIPYKFDGMHTYDEESKIREAMNEWERNTCVRFKKLRRHRREMDNHILITADPTGCHSFIGQVDYIPQQLNLHFKCLWTFGIILHELGHVLGLWHEQQRLDRDNHVKVMWENIGYYFGQFIKQENELDKNIPYDLSSVMHYSPFDGSFNGQPTMKARDDLYNGNMGQRTGLSWYDVYAINKAYCDDSCSNYPQLRCEQGGYQDPNNCYRCKCPDGFDGTNCQNVASSKNANCGGDYYMRAGDKLTIASPNYDNSPYHYDDKQECNWRLRVDHGANVILRFQNEFGLYCHRNSICYHWVEVRFSKSSGLPGARFCCYDTPTMTLQSVDSEMSIVFRTDWDTWSPTFRRGFKAVVESSAKPTVRREERTTTKERNYFIETATIKPNPSIPEWHCDFDTRLFCGITQEKYNDEFDWALKEGPTPSFNTGPAGAFNGKFYIYAETSYPRRPGDRATINLPSIKLIGPSCLSFSYHMQGKHIRALHVTQYNNNILNYLWSRGDSSGDAWTRANININFMPYKTVSIVAIRGEGYAGDIALDDLALNFGYC